MPLLNRDDEQPAAVDISPSTGIVTSEDGSSALIQFRLSTRPQAEVLISFANPDATEFVFDSTEVSIAADDDWQQPRQVLVTGVDDDIVDGDQFGQIDFSVAAGSDPDFLGLSQSVSFVNRDDDEAGVLLELTGPPSIDEGQTTTLALSLRSQPLAPLQITLAARIQSPGLPDDLDYALTPITVQIDPADWDQPLPLTLATTDNQRSTGDRIIEVRIEQISSTDPLYPSLTAPPVEVTVIDQGAAIEALPIPVDRGMGWLIAALLLLASAYLTSRPAPARSEEANHG